MQRGERGPAGARIPQLDDGVLGAGGHHALAGVPVACLHVPAVPRHRRLALRRLEVPDLRALDTINHQRPCQCPSEPVRAHACMPGIEGTDIAGVHLQWQRVMMQMRDPFKQSTAGLVQQPLHISNASSCLQEADMP